MRRRVAFFVAVCLADCLSGILLGTNSLEAAALELKPGSRICYVGNTLAERMQHHGGLETLLQIRFPEHKLVVRNLGYSGDELTLRLRSDGFGTPDDWLTRCQADVIFAFFGYNESYGGEAGLDKFKADLTAQITRWKATPYNGSTPPQVVVFSPIAHENLYDPNLPDGSENNGRIRLYTAAMARIARETGVVFVDLFTPLTKRQRSSPLTINGVHLNKTGDEVVAAEIDRQLFGKPLNPRPQLHAKVNAAVLDKDFHWFQRYRTVDGYSIYGGRADLAFTNGQTNRVVMQREMEVLDVMTANRDARIWSVLAGKDEPVNDDNAPPLLEVITNKPGPLPGGRHVFLSGEDAIARMTPHPDCEVNLFASEEQFPEIANPVQIAFDPRGRLWVATMPSYPHWKPDEKMSDKVVILEDNDGDGRADKCTVFADGLHVPTGLEFHNGGLLVGQQPDLMFLKDTNGDDVADVRERVLHGIDSADTHHALNSFTFDPGGALYFQEGTFHHTQVETPWGPPVRCANAGVFRYEPRTHRFEVYVSYPFANPHGHVFDRWGRDIVTDGTTSEPFDGSLFSVRADFPRKNPRPPRVYNQRTRPCPGTEILSSRHFPEEFQGNYLVGNVIGVLGILRYNVREEGARLVAEEILPPLVLSTDENFRPSDFETGPDGALYFSDWHNPIIGHMQHNLRDPSRDRTHGRVYRITAKGRPTLKAPKIANQTLDRLLDLLKSPEDRVRYRTKLELSSRPSNEVISATRQWLNRLDPKAPEFEHHRLEGLWVHQYHNVVDTSLLDAVLGSPDSRARAAAVRVLCAWRHQVSDTLDRLRKLAADEAPRVRLEAVRAASYLNDPAAIDVPWIASALPRDESLDYVISATLPALEPYWRGAIARNEPLNLKSEAAAAYVLQSMPLDQLLAQPRSSAVCFELLRRPGVRDEDRRSSVRTLAADRNQSEIDVLMSVVDRLDADEKQDTSLLFDVMRLLTGRNAAELGSVRSRIETLATSARSPIIRQVCLVTLMSVDGSVEPTWKLASASISALRDLLTAMPIVSDPGLRAALYPKVEPLLKSLPSGLATKAGAPVGSFGRFVRIELPGNRRTLTLAEVEVYSEGQNVARNGTASQINTAHGGVAARAIDGNKSGSYGDGGQTHTADSSPNPWWELDLGEELPIDKVVVYNRIDGDLGQRLAGFTLTILDGRRQIAVQKTGLDAPNPSSEIPLEGGGAEGIIRRGAMTALTSVRGREINTFQLLAQFIRDDVDRPSAIRALLRVPRQFWPAEEAPALLNVVTAAIRKIPPAERTTPPALDAMELAEGLTTLLPVDQARRARSELSELGVRVIRLNTLLERMAYDKDVIAVRAGRPVEFVFENTDMMPHNFVIVQPGALAEVGELAEASATQPDAAAREYVPLSDKILLASRLLQPRETQKLSFTAPSRPGVYPFVCTYPGHWRRMYGALYVVEDLDEYLTNAETYLAAHPVEIQDDLLKDRRPRTEWKLEDLAPAVATLEGRSYANGRHLFQVANCAACHRMDGVGNEFGPDLTRFDAKWTAVDVLKSILEPSEKIDEKYQTWVFELSNGKTASGLIVDENLEFVKIIENPLASTETVKLRIREIESRQKSPTSMMPKGVLDKLTRDEILDLIAYIAARGDKGSPIFGGDHHH